MLNFWLPPSAGNLFQSIKTMCNEAEGKGMTLTKLSIGQPSGPALLSARQAAAAAVMSDTESMHEYQDNGSPGIPNFARRFVQCHVGVDLNMPAEGQLGFMPIPGIKPILPLVPLACGATRTNDLLVSTTTDPGYPTPKFWSSYLRGMVHSSVPLSPENRFLVDHRDIPFKQTGDMHNGLLMMNYPHNPSGKAADKVWLEELCQYAARNGIRIFNDGAYAILDHRSSRVTLTDVAVKYKNLSWLEAFSASKAGNFTGWRIGAVVGSADFVADFGRIKGDADSGFAAPLAAGVMAAFEHDRMSINRIQEMYAKRLRLLIKTLEGERMHLAVEPEAGFFSLWKVPSRAFGQKIVSAEYFNKLMIEQAGVVGVHFDPYIRYSVTNFEEGMVDKIASAFNAAHVAYH